MKTSSSTAIAGMRSNGLTTAPTAETIANKLCQGTAVRGFTSCLTAWRPAGLRRAQPFVHSSRLGPGLLHSPAQSVADGRLYSRNPVRTSPRANLPP